MHFLVFEVRSLGPMRGLLVLESFRKNTLERADSLHVRRSYHSCCNISLVIYFTNFQFLLTMDFSLMDFSFITKPGSQLRNSPFQDYLCLQTCAHQEMLYEMDFSKTLIYLIATKIFFFTFLLFVNEVHLCKNMNTARWNLSIEAFMVSIGCSFNCLGAR